MIQMSLAQAANITHASLHSITEKQAEALSFSGICIDSRQLQSGELFVALPGANVDGHNFIQDALKAGASAALVSRVLDCAIPQLIVEDTATALSQLAISWRRQCEVRVIGVTGSNGKTTVKNLLAGILSQVVPTLATPGNFNNELGLPLTLCQLDQSHRFAVLEMGARKPGDIEVLAAMAAPSVGIVTNAGPAHLETFGDLDGVARVKGEMFSALPNDGIAILNADDDYADEWRLRCGERRVISFGRHPQADVRSDCTGPECRFVTPKGEVDVTLQLHGSHNVMNALAACAAAIALDVPLHAIANGLAGVAPETGRLQYHTSASGWTIIDDTYNANPASLYAAITTAIQESDEELWLVLGDMGELGESARKMHAEMGEAARQMGVSRFFAVGDLSKHAVNAFGIRAGEYFDDRQHLVERLCHEIHPGVRCLVKGSRSAGMEQVVQSLLHRCEGGAA